MEKLNPDALAECDGGDEREGVQPVTAEMIYSYVVISDVPDEGGELPKESARPFATWLDEVWNDFNEDPEMGLTNSAVVSAALSYWRGQ